MSESTLPSSFEESIRSLYADRYVSSKWSKLRYLVIQTYVLHQILVAGITILLYDILLTLNDELQIIWMRKKTLPHIAYLVNRYGVLFLDMFLVYSE